MSRAIRKAQKDREQSWASSAAVPDSGHGMPPAAGEVLGQSLLSGSVDCPASPMSSSTRSRVTTTNLPIKEKFERLQSKNSFEISNADREVKVFDMQVEAKSLEAASCHTRRHATAPRARRSLPSGASTARSCATAISGHSSRMETPYSLRLGQMDYDSLALPPIIVKEDDKKAAPSVSPLGDMQVHVLAKRLLERSADAKKRLPESKTGNFQMPVYFRGTDNVDSARSLGDVSHASSEEDVIVRAYAAALGMNFDISEDTLLSGSEGTMEAIDEQLSDLVQSLHAARQHSRLSPHKNVHNHSVDASSSLLDDRSRALSAPDPPSPDDLLSSRASIPQEYEYSVERDGGDSIGSTDIGDDLENDAFQSLTRKSDTGFDFDDDNDDIDNEMRELLRTRRASAKSSGTLSDTRMRAMSASHSVNTVVRSARSAAAKSTKGPGTGGQRAQICASPLRAGVSLTNSAKSAMQGGHIQLPDITAVSVKSKKTVKPRLALSASASDSVLKRDIMKSASRRRSNGSRVVVNLSQSLSVIPNKN